MNNNSNINTSKYQAHWITDPNCNSIGYGVYHFRKKFKIKSLPPSFIIHITADNRYSLFVNGESVCSGPARGDLSQWYYETIDIKPFLKYGTNLIAVIVWNMGEFKPVAQISLMTGLCVQGSTIIEKVINTNESWRVIQSPAYTPCSINNTKRLLAYMVVGPGDRVVGSKYLWDWNKLEHDDKKWHSAKILAINQQSKVKKNDQWWKLIPRNIPLMFEIKLRIPLVRRTKGITLPDDFFENKRDLIIAPYKQISILLDQTYLTVGYPEITLSNGKFASVKLTYAEALFDSEGNKSNRNDIVDKDIAGNYDIFYQDGGINRLYRPLWLRTFRYIQLDIITHEEALIIEDFYSIKSGYPLELKASFECDDESLQEIWKVGWRTVQLCAGELFYDSPYYEQLQYIADSRIQALIAVYVTGDDRLMKKAILDFFHSKLPDGLTQSRYPSNKIQIIPPYSLFWISMIHDFWMHKQDDLFIKQFIPNIIDILDWFIKKIDKKTKMLGPLPFWNFVDWDNFDLRSTAPGAKEGGSSIITLQLACTIKEAVQVLNYFDNISKVDGYLKIAASLTRNTWKLCYNKHNGLISDTPQRLTYSQHAGIWAVLSDAVIGANLVSFIETFFHNKGINQVSYFYRFYLSKAINKGNLAHLYHQEMDIWRNMISLGLTTFAETSEETRSDCHGWSASPVYDFLSTICGITAAECGFKKISIKPSLGLLTRINVSMPHPLGMIMLEIVKSSKNGFKASISIPVGLKGEFQWEDNIFQLKEGQQCFEKL